jgi:hypothetical protein
MCAEYRVGPEMRVRLLEPHVINNVWLDKLTEMDLPPSVRPTPLMVALDDEARAAILKENIDVFGRWVLDDPGPPARWHLLDDPPIPRPITDPQPVPPIGAPREAW